MVIIEFMDMKSTKFGGLGRFMIRLMQNMPDAKFHFVFQNFPQSEEMVQIFHNLNAEIHVIDTEGKRAIKNIFKVYKLFRIVKPDIVHFHFSNSFFLYAPLAKCLGIKHLFKTQHCCFTKDDLTQIKSKDQFNLKTKIASWNGHIYKLFDKIIMCGKYVEKQFKEIYGPSDNYQMIYFGVEPVERLSEESIRLMREQYKISKDDVVIVTTAFANPVKGVDVLIKALSYIKSKHFVVILLGLDESLPLTQYYHQLAISLGVDSFIRWIGITRQVGHFLSIADIYCQPSRSEALTLAVCEAKSVSLPIVGANVGGLPEISDLVFPCEDSSSLGALLDLLIGNKNKRLDLGHQSYNSYLANFSIHDGIDGYSRLYREGYAFCH